MTVCDLSIARRLAELPGVIVGVSGGKDATATLDLCKRFCPGKIVGFFWYMVEGLEFQERYLRYLERRFEIEILRLPHYFNALYLATGAYAAPEYCPQIDREHSFAYIREQSGLDWIALGDRKKDSFFRLKRITEVGGWDTHERIAYPVGDWTSGQVLAYLKSRNLMIPPEWKIGLTTSFGGFLAGELKAIKEHYPDDYEKIQARFPFIEAAVKRGEMLAARKAAERAAAARERAGK